MPTIELVPLKELPEKEWRELLELSPISTVYHTPEWMRVWVQTFPSWRGFFIILRQEDKLIAGIPIIKVKRFGLKSYYSMPYGTYGGIVGEVEKREEIVSYLLKQVKGPFKRIYIADFGGTLNRTTGFQPLKITTHITNLSSDPDKLWREKIHKKIKEQVRESKRKEVRIKLLKREEEIPICYEMLLETTRRHRERRIKFPLQLYKNIFRIMPNKENLRWTVALRENTYLSYLISFLYKGTIYFWSNASFKEAFPYRPNNALFWETIERGCKNGFKYANLGASPLDASGLIRWKERLGGEKVVYNEYRWESWIWKLLKR